VKRSNRLIQQALHLVDAAIFNVKTIEGELLPTVTVDASVGRSWNPSNTVDLSNNAQIFGNVSIPIYQGGGVYSRVRQAKEELGQTRLQLDVARDQVRANVITAWGIFQAAEASIVAARAAVEAQQLALEGVIEEQRVGQRTTLDVSGCPARTGHSTVQSGDCTAEPDRWWLSACRCRGSSGR
jgi:outer membrane protein